jgi:hypothetical protein
MNKLYIQNDSRDNVNNFLYFNDDAILILDNFIKTSFPDSIDLDDYLAWTRTPARVEWVRILTPDMLERVYNFSSLMGWGLVIVHNDFGVPESFIESCKGL